MSLYLAPPTSTLTDAVANEEGPNGVRGWLSDDLANQDMGYGSGENGALRAYEGFLGAFEGQSLMGVYRDDEVPVGFVILTDLPAAQVAQFHGLVAPKYRKTIYAARLIQAVEKATLGNGTYRLETEVLTRNHRAIRLLKGLGFKPEGAHKDRHLMDGKRETTVTLRLLKKEWRP